MQSRGSAPHFGFGLNAGRKPTPGAILTGRERNSVAASVVLVSHGLCVEANQVRVFDIGFDIARPIVSVSQDVAGARNL